jgi:predicted O-methyltransferase YrrM
MADKPEVVVTGGAKLYAAALDAADRKSNGIVYGRGYQGANINIKQNRDEIIAFLDLLMLYSSEPVWSPGAAALEIGLDEGGTHMLWRALFKKVTSVDISEAAIARFKGLLGDHPSGTARSAFVCANSTLPGTRIAVTRLVTEPVDLLFIDGDHNYAAVESDYLNYEPLVRKGGIVAFHDVVGTEGPRRFVEELKAGTLPWAAGPLTGITIIGKQQGIAYYVKG